HLLRSAYAAGARGGGHAVGPFQGSAVRADPPLHPPGRGAQPQEDHLRVRARLAGRRRLPPAGGPLRRSGVHAGRDGGRVKAERRKSLAADPLDSEEVLERFYRPTVAGASDHAPPLRAKPDKPTHYKVVCISLYNEDIAHLEALVAELKRRGHTKA